MSSDAQRTVIKRFAVHSPLEDATDDGNAELFVRKYGDRVRFVPSWGRWLVWTGQRWLIDELNQARDFMRAAVRSLYREAADAADGDEQKALAARAKKGRSQPRMKGALWIAESDPRLVRAAHDFDKDPWRLNVQNGTLDLRSGELSSHDPDDLFTKLAPVHYDREARAPVWENFLSRVLPDVEVRAFLQRSLGYSLTGDTGEECVFINHGGGANGKTTAFETVRAVLGDYSIALPQDTVLRARGSSIPNDLAKLPGRRFATITETPEDRRLDEERIKALASGDQMAARFMRAEWFEFRPRAKFWLATNHRPTIFGADDGIWRRIRLIPWSVQIPREEQDRGLRERLEQELPGVLAWMVQGCLDWQRYGLEEPNAVQEATAEYRREEDAFGAFLEERCELVPEAFTNTSRIRQASDEWFKANEYDTPTQKAIASRLRSKGCSPDKISHARGWRGIIVRGSHE